MAKAFVTGATGFIGGHLAEALVRRGDEVRCLVRSTSDVSLLGPLGVELIQGDLLDRDAMKEAVRGVDTVYHLAGVTKPMPRREMMQINAEAVDIVSGACAAQPKSPVMVLVSSIAASGPARRDRPKRESELSCPVSLYGQSKRAGERAAEGWAREVPTTIVRPGIVFGARNREMLPIFEAIRWTRLHLIPTLFPPPLSYIEVGDLVDLMLRAGDHGKRLSGTGDGDDDAGAGYYFACTSEYPNYGQLGRLVANALGYRHIVLMPCIEPVVWTIGTVGQFLGRMMPQAANVNLDKMRDAMVESWACSSMSARRELGFAPQRSLADGLGATADWYREHGWL